MYINSSRLKNQLITHHRSFYQDRHLFQHIEDVRCPNILYIQKGLEAVLVFLLLFLELLVHSSIRPVYSMNNMHKQEVVDVNTFAENESNNNIICIKSHI